MQLLGDVLGAKRDVVTDLQVATAKQTHFFKKRLKVEITLKDGTRRYFRCKSIHKDEAIQEVLYFVDCIEKELHQNIVWRFTDCIWQVKNVQNGN